MQSEFIAVYTSQGSFSSCPSSQEATELLYSVPVFPVSDAQTQPCSSHQMKKQTQNNLPYAVPTEQLIHFEILQIWAQCQPGLPMLRLGYIQLLSFQSRLGEEWSYSTQRAGQMAFLKVNGTLTTDVMYPWPGMNCLLLNSYWRI